MEPDAAMEQEANEPLPETSEIQRLDEDTVRRITAEQAISDLASIVKELIDNALDAESTTIKIRLFGQGLDIIEVSDDGNGVPVGSRPYLATRHATSKIERLEDIYEGTGLTMGFRGEALFAMACTSESLVVASRTEDDELATKIVFGKDGKPTNGGGDAIARKVGTTVAVVQPFGNLPARKADLVRRIQQERTKIFKLVESYGVFNVGVGFRLLDIRQNREDLALATSASSASLKETASTLLGPAFLKGTQSVEVCLESFFRAKQTSKGSSSAEDDICYHWGIKGLLSLEPSLVAEASQPRQQRRGAGGTSKKAASRARIVQYYSINGRVVDLPRVTTLLKRLWTQAASAVPSLKQKKPSALLEFTLPNDAFDINLSPDKKTVLFTHEDELLGIIEEKVTDLWSSSGVFVDGSLSRIGRDNQRQQQQQEQRQQPSKEPQHQEPQAMDEEEPNERDAAMYEYEYDLDDTSHKQRRRNAFSHDISKAKMQHQMAERRPTDDSIHVTASEITEEIADEIAEMEQHDQQQQQQQQREKEPQPQEPKEQQPEEEEERNSQPERQHRKRPLKQTTLNTVVMTQPSQDAPLAQPTTAEEEMQQSPATKKSKLSLPESDDRAEQTFPSRAEEEKEEVTERFSSPEDKVSDLEKRKWTEIQSKFRRNTYDDDHGDAEPSSRYESTSQLPPKAPITPEDSKMDTVDDSSSSLPRRGNTDSSSSRPRTGIDLQQFAFRSSSSTPNRSDSDAGHDRYRRSKRSSMPPPENRPPSPLKTRRQSNEPVILSPARRESIENRVVLSPASRGRERHANESIPLPLTDRDHRVQSNRRNSREFEQADENMNTEMKDAEESDESSGPIVWGSYTSTEDICLSARLERLNMRKRKREINDIRRSIRAEKSDSNTSRTENPKRLNSGQGRRSSNEVSKEVAFDDDVEDDNRDDSTFIRMPKSTFRNGMQVIGQFNLGFILARCSRNHLWILDQHACDEQYNYEQLIQNTVMHEQPLIAPLPLELTPSEEACVLDHMDIFEANGFKFSFDDQAPIRHRLSLTALPHSGAHEGRRAVQFGPSDVSTLCAILTEGSSYDAGSGGTGTDGSGMYGNNAVRRHAGTTSSDRSDRLLARLPKAVAMFASRACRTSVMIGTALSRKEMNSIVQKLAQVNVPWNCPHGRPTMRHVANAMPMLIKDERRAAEHIAIPTITVVPASQEEEAKS